MDSDSEFVVLDTSVVSILFNEDDDERYPYYQKRIAGRRCFISFQTVEELLYWRIAGTWGAARTLRLRDHIAQYEIVWPDDVLVHISARLRSDLKRIGRTLDVADAWIAATALMRQCPLASDDRDFRQIPGLPLIQSHQPRADNSRLVNGRSMVPLRRLALPRAPRCRSGQPRRFPPRRR